MKHFNTLTHITDVGSSNGDGIDSTIRIKKQYERLGIETPVVISAGHSPLHVAFAACSEVSPNARKNAKLVSEIIGNSKVVNPPIALNSAPRNSNKPHRDGKEDNIYRVNINNGDLRFVLYGPKVLKWVVNFYGKSNLNVDRILSISDIIPDTSCGSQFRSAEHLPIAHVLEANDILNDNSKRENVDLSEIKDVFDDNETVLVVPPDEYGNGRLIASKELIASILEKEKIEIPGIIDKRLLISDSLTNVKPDELSIWPSSNYFPNDSLGVMNLGTRWKPNTTRTTNVEVMELSKKLSFSVGKTYKVNI